MDYILTRNVPSELRHHGIKGQRWGVRRYRNEDGTLTEEGKARLKDIGENAKAYGILGGIAGGVAGAMSNPRLLQRGMEFADAAIGLPFLENRKYIFYNKGSENIMKILGAVGGAVIGYKIAKNTALRVQGKSPKKYKQEMEETKNGV